MDRYRFKSMIKTVGYTILWLGIILFATRQSILTFKETQPQPKQQVQVASVAEDVPDAAKTTARKFLIHWLYTKGDENPSEKIERMEKYMTSGLEDRLKQNKSLLITLESGEKKGIQANSIDLWQADWKVKGSRGVITYNVVMQDGRNLYVKVPVVKSGTWLVDGLPALVPEPKRKEKPEQESIAVPDPKKIEAVVDGFFSAWLSGKTEAISRYSKADIPTSDMLEKLQGQYQEVSVEGLSEKPFKVQATVKIQDVYGQTYSLEYRLTMEKSDNQWFITGME